MKRYIVITLILIISVLIIVSVGNINKPVKVPSSNEEVATDYIESTTEDIQYLPNEDERETFETLITVEDNTSITVEDNILNCFKSEEDNLYTTYGITLDYTNLKPSSIEGSLYIYVLVRPSGDTVTVFFNTEGNNVINYTIQDDTLGG